MKIRALNWNKSKDILECVYHYNNYGWSVLFHISFFYHYFLFLLPLLPPISYKIILKLISIEVHLFSNQSTTRGKGQVEGSTDTFLASVTMATKVAESDRGLAAACHFSFSLVTYPSRNNKFRSDWPIFYLIASMNSVLRFLQICTKFVTQKSVTIEWIESASKCTTHHLISLNAGLKGGQPKKVNYLSWINCSINSQFWYIIRTI